MYTLKAIYSLVRPIYFYFPERSFLFDFGFNPAAFLSSGVISLIFPLSSFNPVSGFGIGITPYMITPIPIYRLCNCCCLRVGNGSSPNSLRTCCNLLSNAWCSESKSWRLTQIPSPELFVIIPLFCVSSKLLFTISTPRLLRSQSLAQSFCIRYPQRIYPFATIHDGCELEIDTTALVVHRMRYFRLCPEYHRLD